MAMQEYVETIDGLMEDLHIFQGMDDADIGEYVEKYKSIKSNTVGPTQAHCHGKIYFEERYQAYFYHG